MSSSLIIDLLPAILFIGEFKFLVCRLRFGSVAEAGVVVAQVVCCIVLSKCCNELIAKDGSHGFPHLGILEVD